MSAPHVCRGSSARPHEPIVYIRADDDLRRCPLCVSYGTLFQARIALARYLNSIPEPNLDEAVYAIETADDILRSGLPWRAP